MSKQTVSKPYNHNPNDDGAQKSKQHSVPEPSPYASHQEPGTEDRIKSPTLKNSYSSKEQPAQKRLAAKKNHKNRPSRYAALDLGTNNCRLLIAAPRGKEMRIVDAFSRIVRLGENLSRTGELSNEAMERTIEVLKICADKIRYRGVTHMRLIATQACRGARNGELFLKRVHEETGLELEIINPEEEARLAMLGCKDLFDPEAKAVLVFDIGGGSTEISWVKLSKEHGEKGPITTEIAAWSSLPFGVVSLAEKWDGRDISRATYEKIIDEVGLAIDAVGDAAGLKNLFMQREAHLLGTSGTVTSIAGVKLNLERYRRMDVDGLWLSAQNIVDVSEELRALDFEGRAKQPCIGRERADLVVCGCAILEGIMKYWPTDRVRVADRGLREGMLIELAQQDRRERRARARRKKKNRR